ncbi:MAG TPA: VWA domain-containing protein, partial [Chthoniobacteraceae bacterium]
MSFLTPWLLYGFAALAAPIIIHLWQRKRVVKVAFSTLRFLKVVAARTSRSAKVENLLLLLLRCLIVALVIAAAARPVVSTESARFFGGNVPRTVAIVIDQSTSMGYKSGDETRLERAKEQAQAVIDDLKSGDEVAVISVNDRPQMLVAEPTVNHAVARQAIEGVQLTEGKTDFSAALREARKAVGQKVRGVKQIFLFTDNQESGWRFDHNATFDDAWKQMNPKFVVVRPDDLSPVNAAVTKVRFDTPFAAAGTLARGIATVENHSAAALRDLLEIKIGNDRLAQKPVEAGPGTTVEVPFEFQTPTVSGRWLQGSANLSGDNLPADDHAYFLLPLYQAPRVVIVEQGEGPEKARPAFFLRKALAAGSAGAPIKTITPNELDEFPVDPYSAVFLAGVPNISDRSSVRLDRYLESGGTVVFFPSDQTEISSIARLEWLPAKPTKIVELPVGRLAARALEPQHPLFTNSWDANTPFPALPQRKMLQWDLNKDGHVLLTL